jgi:hypothetical protein
MDKSAIEKRITARAERRYQQDFDSLIKTLANNPIISKLKFEIDGKEWRVVWPHSSDSDSLIDIRSINAPKSNAAKIKAELIAKYEQEETDAILSKLESVAYLFDEGVA